MINTYYKKLSEENKEIAVYRIANCTNSSKKIVKKALEINNPVMGIEKNKVVINRYSYDRLYRIIQNEKRSVKTDRIL